MADEKPPVSPTLDDLSQEIIQTQQLVQNVTHLYMRQSEAFEAVAGALVVLRDAAQVALTVGVPLVHPRLEAAMARADAALRLLRANATRLDGGWKNRAVNQRQMECPEEVHNVTLPAGHVPPGFTPKPVR